MVAGVSGAGKTTLAGQLGQILDLPCTELDSLYHGPHWTPHAGFEDDVDQLTRAPGWVTEWQYRQVRRLRGEELWNDNFECSLWSIFTDRDHIIRWGWRTRHSLKGLVPPLEGKFSGLHVVRLTSPAEVDAWRERLAAMLAEPARGAGS